MKSLNQFKNEPSLVLEEEKPDYSKFDMLVRAGLANKAQLQRIHKILDKMSEERPTFNNADRMIMQNLFNKMVDLVSNNKQLFQQTRRIVREEEEIEEGVIASSDFKIGPSGKKIRAHRIHLTKNAQEVEDESETEEKLKEEVLEEQSHFDPPAVLVLRRKAIRMFSNDTRIALYYNDKINKYFSVPYSTTMNIDAPLQAQEEVQVNESVMDQLHKIVDGKQAQKVKFGNGQSKTVDHFTASAITQVHKALNDENKKKIADMVHKSPEHFHKVASFAFSKVK